MNYLEYVLAKTGGALFVRLDTYAQLVGLNKQTPHNQIHHGSFPLPIFRIGRTVTVKAVDLALFLETGIAPAGAQSKRGPGRPRKYSDAARARAGKGKKANAVTAVSEITRGAV